MKITKINTKKLGEFLEDVWPGFSIECTTGATMFYDVHGRRYEFSVDYKKGQKPNVLKFRLTSQDFCPSGFDKSGTEKTFGNFNLSFSKRELESDTKEILMTVLEKMDPDFWYRYGKYITPNMVTMKPGGLSPAF